MIGRASNWPDNDVRLGLLRVRQRASHISLICFLFVWEESSAGEQGAGSRQCVVFWREEKNLAKQSPAAKLFSFSYSFLFHFTSPLLFPVSEFLLLFHLYFIF
jgi:hypothetical protein